MFFCLKWMIYSFHLFSIMRIHKYHCNNYLSLGVPEQKELFFEEEKIDSDNCDSYDRIKNKQQFAAL